MRGQLRIVWRAKMRVPGLTVARVRLAMERLWSLYGQVADSCIEVVVLHESEHTHLHAVHSQDPTATDVLAFPFDDPDLLGEIVVNGDCALREAQERQLSAADEALLYIVHGALHLLGFRDDTPGARRKMRDAESKVLHKEV